MKLDNNNIYPSWRVMRTGVAVYYNKVVAIRNSARVFLNFKNLLGYSVGCQVLLNLTSIFKGKQL